MTDGIPRIAVPGMVLAGMGRGLLPEPRCPFIILVVTIRMLREVLKSLADEVMRHIIEIHNRFDRLLIEPIDKREPSGALWTTTTDH